MGNSRIEIMVGIFLVIGFLAFGWLSLRLGEVSLFADGDALEFARPISSIVVTAGDRPVTLLTRRQESFYKQVSRTFFDP